MEESRGCTRKEASRAVTTSGNITPADPAEAIAAWKREEQRTAAELSRRIAAFNPSGARLLGDWVPVFDYTARCAEFWLQTLRARPEGAGGGAGGGADGGASSGADGGASGGADDGASSVASGGAGSVAGYAAIPEPHGRALAEAAQAQTEAFAGHLERLADGARVSGRAEEADALAQAAEAARARLAKLAELAQAAGLARQAWQTGQGGQGWQSWLAGQAGQGWQPGQTGQAGQGWQPGQTGQAGQGWPAGQTGAGPDRVVPIGGHTLPPLPYAYDALEPYIDEKTMRLHHDLHHRAYVDGLNRAELALQEARVSGQFDLVKHWERELAFNGAGHYLHTLFWNTMSPGGGGRPTGALAAAIDASFGSYEAFQRQFSAAAAQVEGGGWAILVWSPRSGRLEILQAEKHQNLSQWDVVPLLPLDVWEHAYYLKHQNRRADYIRDWWNVVNWPCVAERFAKASQLRWEPY
jgi:Fe-Mn family superoxide dismutase